MTAPATRDEQQLSPFQAAVPALALLYSQAMARIRERVAEFIRSQFRHPGSWRDHDAKQFVRAVTPMVLGAQHSVSTLTSAYMNEVATELTGVSRPPSGVPSSVVSGSAVRGGVDPVVVYRRPYTQVWTDLAAGAPLEVALDHGERRALTIANTDLQLAKTHTAKHEMAKDERVVGYRRVPQGDHTCALCLIVSTRRYHKENLAAVHPNCDCDVEAIHGEFDPGPVLDEAFLKAVHDAIARDLGKDYVADSGKAESTAKRELNYRDIVIVHQHGEIGPVLGVRGQHWTGPDQIRRLTHHKIT